MHIQIKNYIVKKKKCGPLLGLLVVFLIYLMSECNACCCDFGTKVAAAYTYV
jgi:hypothetical protein